MLEAAEDITTIYANTYGIMPKDHGSGFRLTLDSGLAAAAAKQLALKNPNSQVIIIGANYFNQSGSDATMMKNKITHEAREKTTNEVIIPGIAEERVMCETGTLNTVTQIARIALLQEETEKSAKSQGNIAHRNVVVVADWQRKDAEQLLENYRIKTVQIITDKEILTQGKNNADIKTEQRSPSQKMFDRLEQQKIYKLKSDGLQARIFNILNKVDKKGRVRNCISRKFGVGIADIGYRGLESRAYEFQRNRSRRVKDERKRRNMEIDPYKKTRNREGWLIYKYDDKERSRIIKN